MDKLAIISAFTLQMLVAIGLLFFVCAGILSLIYAHLQIDVDWQKPQADIFVQRLLFSQGGIAARDPVTGRVSVTTVDKARFQRIEGQEDEWFDYQRHLGARIVMGGETRYLGKAYWDRRWPVVEARYKQSFGATASAVPPLPDGAYFYKLPVKVREEDGGLSEGILEVTVVMEDG